MEKCSECGREVPPEETEEIDGNKYCKECVYNGSDPYEVYPIGIVKNNLSRADKGFGTKGHGESVIELWPFQERFAYKLEDEKYICVVYRLHQARPVRSVFHRGLDGKETGVFATRTPDRLSRTGIQDVKLLRVEGRRLHVEGLDAIDGTPVLDIKMLWSNIMKRPE